MVLALLVLALHCLYLYMLYYRTPFCQKDYGTRALKCKPSAGDMIIKKPECSACSDV